MMVLSLASSPIPLPPAQSRRDAAKGIETAVASVVELGMPPSVYPDLAPAILTLASPGFTFGTMRTRSAGPARDEFAVCCHGDHSLQPASCSVGSPSAQGSARVSSGSAHCPPPMTISLASSAMPLWVGMWFSRSRGRSKDRIWMVAHHGTWAAGVQEAQGEIGKRTRVVDCAGMGSMEFSQPWFLLQHQCARCGLKVRSRKATNGARGKGELGEIGEGQVEVRGFAGSGRKLLNVALDQSEDGPGLTCSTAVCAHGTQGHQISASPKAPLARRPSPKMQQFCDQPSNTPTRMTAHERQCERRVQTALARLRKVAEPTPPS